MVKFQDCSLEYHAKVSSLAGVWKVMSHLSCACKVEAKQTNISSSNLFVVQKEVT